MLQTTIIADCTTRPSTPSDQGHHTDCPHYIGPYQVEAVLGVGAMSACFLARDPDIGEAVCVKILLPELWNSIPARARFSREIEALSGIDHPNVVRFLGAGEATTVDGHQVPYLVMEHLQGSNLQNVLDQSGPMPAEELIPLIVDVARGLSALHQRGLIHRDLKPANVFREKCGRAKIIDLGLARPVHNFGWQTADHTICGTPYFMSPEQLEGKPLDHATDLFSLGCLLYTLATGMPAFHESTLHELRSRHLESTLALDTDGWRKLPAGLASVLHRLFQRDPTKRFRSADEVMRALTAAAKRADPARTTILIAEDDPMQMKLLGYHLENWGHHVECAGRLEAIETVLTQATVDLVLLDWELGEHSGVEVLQRMRRLAPDVPVIVLTAHASLDLAVTATKLGSQEFLAKPVSWEKLRQRIANTVQRTHSRISPSHQGAL